MPCNPSGIDDLPIEPIIGPDDEDEIVILGEDGEILEDIIDDLPPDDSVAGFHWHRDSVFTCNFNKSGELAISGGQDDQAMVWRSLDGIPEYACNHTDSVIAAAFNHDSTFACTAGMDSLLQIWEVESGTRVSRFEMSEFRWMEVHPSENMVFAGTEDGDCWKVEIPDGDVNVIYPGHGVASTCGKLLPNASTFVSGYQDGTVKLWDVLSVSEVGAAKGKDAHKNAVNCIACNKDGSLIATGSEDGRTKLLRATDCKVVKNWNCCKPDLNESVEGVDFFENHPFVATGTNEGILRIWDISTTVQRSIVELDSTITKVVCGKSSPLVYFSCNQYINLFDGRSAELVRRWEGHLAIINDFALSEDGTKIVTASDDQECKIFQIT